MLVCLKGLWMQECSYLAGDETAHFGRVPMGWFFLFSFRELVPFPFKLLGTG